MVMQARQIIDEMAEDPKRFMLDRPRCCKCGCRLFDGFCSDDACPYSDYSQDVELDDLYNLDVAAFGAKYGRNVRRLRQEAEDPKALLKQLPPTQFTVDSTWEDWTVDGQGNILAHGEAQAPRGVHWRNVKKFDVEGYKQRTGNYPTGVINIHDISYWQHDGSKISCVSEVRWGRGRQPLA